MAAGGQQTIGEVFGNRLLAVLQSEEEKLDQKLAELDNALTSDTVKYSQMEAIATKLKSIPSGTQAHLLAQQMIAEVRESLEAIALTSAN